MTVDLGEFGGHDVRPPVRQDRTRLVRPRGRRSLVLAAALVVAAADLVLAVVRHAAADGGGDPVQTAQRFYDAVRTQDATTALGLLDLPAGTNRRLLSASALSRTYGLPRAGATLVGRHGDEAEVEVTYTIGTVDAQPAAIDLHLQRSDPTGFAGQRRWRVVSGLPTVTVLASAAVHEVEVAGTRVPLDTRGTVTLPSWPGLVPATSVATPLVTSVFTVLVAGGVVDPSSQTLAPGPSSGATAAVEFAVSAAFAQRTDRIQTEEPPVVGEFSYTAESDHLEINGYVGQELPGRGCGPTWTTTAVVRSVGGRAVASDVTITPDLQSTC